MKKCEHCGAEHYEDSELPVTEGWLRAVGFEGWSPRLGPLQVFDDGTALLYDVEPDTEVRIPGRFGTRGDVRRLCRALGVTLEGTP